MALPLAGLLGGMAMSGAKDLAGPVISQSMSDFRNALGWNDISRARALMYRQQYESTQRALNDNFTPFRLSYEQAMTAFNQGNWRAADADPARRLRLWQRLQSNLKYVGVNIDITEQAQSQPEQPGAAGVRAREWARLIDMSSAASPLHNVIHDYYRSKWLDAGLRNVSEDELGYHLRRAQIRRKNDRDIIMRPFFHYDHADAYRLKWLGLVDNRGKESILEAGGCVRAIDQEYMEHLSRRLPGHEQLIHWAEQDLWNEQSADLLGLDRGWNRSPVPEFFMKAQGIGVNDIPLPGEPAAGTDWIKLLYRSTRKVPSYEEAKHLMYRLRPSANDPGMSIVPGIPTWMERHTIAALVHHGMPDLTAKALAATSYKVLDTDFVGETLSQALEHPSVMRLKNRLFGRGYQWLTDELLNHGFDARIAELMTEVVKQIAIGKAFAEKHAKIKTIRQEFRDGVFKSYEQGTITRADTINSTRHRMFTERMATEQCNNIDQKVIRDVNQIKIDGIKDAYMNGLLPGPQVQQQLAQIIVNPDRILQYMETWLWERTTQAKHQSTGEILASLKAGLATPAQTIMRLTNLGWRNPDAIAEVALAQHEMQVSQAKQAAAVAAHNAALIQAKAHQAAAEKAKAQKEAQKAANEKLGVDKLVAKANHKRLLDESKYYADIHQANARYAAAEKAGNQELMNAEIQKSQVAYQRWLLGQIQLITQAPEVANAIPPFTTEPRPNTGQNTGASQPPPSNEPPPVRPPGENSGPPPTEEPEPTVP